MKLRDGVSLAELEFGMALLDERSGEYWNLNPTAALILRTMLEGGSEGQVVEQLTNQYHVDRAMAGEDVTALVTELRSAGLVSD